MSEKVTKVNSADDFFEVLIVKEVWQSTRKSGSLFWKKEVPYYTPYSNQYLVCKICGLKITVESNAGNDMPLKPKDILTFKELHALRHQVAGEYPPKKA